MIDQIKDVVKELRHRLFKGGNVSNLGEVEVIRKYLKKTKVTQQVCVDIAASDGTTQSNTLFLYQSGWSGLAVEYDSRKFAILASHYKQFPEVNLLRTKVIPTNVVSILQANLIPSNFGFLNLDIDSYDYFVLEQILSKYRPQLICTEVNEKIPPPIRFTVKYSKNHSWAGDHFYGQSLSQLGILAEKYKYKLIGLHYNNAFLVPREVKQLKEVNIETAYDNGYRYKTDRKKKFPWNKDMESLLNMNPEQGVKFLKSKFANYKGMFVCQCSL